MHVTNRNYQILFVSSRSFLSIKGGNVIRCTVAWASFTPERLTFEFKSEELVVLLDNDFNEVTCRNGGGCCFLPEFGNGCCND